jgi:hypothetical protein
MIARSFNTKNNPCDIDTRCLGSWNPPQHYSIGGKRALACTSWIRVFDPFHWVFSEEKERKEEKKKRL